MKRLFSGHWAPAALGLALALAPLPARAAQSLRLTLDGCERAALAYAPALKEARLDADAAQRQVAAARAALLPRLGLEGNYTYNGQIIPPATLPSQFASAFGTNQLDFGFHDVWSFGVSANWDIFSVGADLSQLRAARQAERAAQAQAEAARRGLLLRTRMDYFLTRQDQTQLQLDADTLRLYQSQLADMGRRFRAGAVSRVDWLKASDDELNQRGTYRLDEAELSEALRDLFAVTGQNQDADVSLPLDARDAASLPAHVEAPTLVVALDSTDALTAAMAPAETAAFQPRTLPQLVALWAEAREAWREADAAFAGHFPSGGVGFTESEQYPQEPLPRQVNQQTTNAEISVPLFAFGQVHDAVLRQRDFAKAADAQASDQGVLTRTQWREDRDLLAGLKVQRGLQAREVKQSDELRDMVYRAYKIGDETFLDVQQQDRDTLQDGLRLALTETKMLIELADLSAITENDR